MYIVIRISNGKLNGTWLFNDNDVDNAKQYTFKKYKELRKSNETTKSFEQYLDTCICSDLRFEYPYDGCVYENETIVMQKIETYKTTEKEETENGNEQ